LNGVVLRNAVFFAALPSTALAMGAALAHALELPNKIVLARRSRAWTLNSRTARR
jgi:hypothetical protein